MKSLTALVCQKDFRVDLVRMDFAPPGFFEKSDSISMSERFRVNLVRTDFAPPGFVEKSDSINMSKKA